MKVKKIVLAPAVIPAKPACQAPAKWSVVYAGNAMRTNREYTERDDHHDGVDLGRLAGAADQQQCAPADQNHGGQVDDAWVVVARWSRHPNRFSRSLFR
jgi:hypothetical protein